MATPPATRVHRRLTARILFRLVAVALGLSPLLVVELICRANGWGIVEEAVDPFVGFAAEHPL